MGVIYSRHQNVGKAMEFTSIKESVDLYYPSHACYV